MDAIRVSSRQNVRFKAALDLREPRKRRAQRRVIVDGAREIARALDAGVPMLEAWVSPEDVRGDAARALLPRVSRSGAVVVEAPPELLARLAYGDRHAGLVGVFEEPETVLSRLRLSDRPLVAVVEHVEKPGNLGAVLRSADGAGLDAVIVADPVSDPWSPNAIRASLGTIFSLPLAVCTAAEAIGTLRAADVAIVAARVDGERDYDAVDYVPGVAIVLGSEDAGLSDAWRAEDVVGVRIPMLGRADSLNVAASAAVLFYEARRQRRAA